jgi:hypothetical protein
LRDGERLLDRVLYWENQPTKCTNNVAALVVKKRQVIEIRHRIRNKKGGQNKK